MKMKWLQLWYVMFVFYTFIPLKADNKFAVTFTWPTSPSLEDVYILLNLITDFKTKTQKENEAQQLLLFKVIIMAFPVKSFNE